MPRVYSDPRSCDKCGETFFRNNGNVKARFCSQKCWLQVKNTPEAGRHAAQEGREKIQDARHSTHSGEWYRKVDGEHEHRSVARQSLGRDLLPGEVVHHEDRDKTNNDPDNLWLFPSQSEHFKHHRHGEETECNCTHTRL